MRDVLINIRYYVVYLCVDVSSALGAELYSGKDGERCGRADVEDGREGEVVDSVIFPSLLVVQLASGVGGDVDDAVRLRRCSARCGKRQRTRVKAGTWRRGARVREPLALPWHTCGLQHSGP